MLALVLLQIVDLIWEMSISVHKLDAIISYNDGFHAGTVQILNSTSNDYLSAIHEITHASVFLLGLFKK